MPESTPASPDDPATEPSREARSGVSREAPPEVPQEAPPEASREVPPEVPQEAPSGVSREAPPEVPREVPRPWSELTAGGAARALERDPVLVLLLAATEQHGPHLPLSTDLEIGKGILAEAFRRLPADVPVWSLPPVPVGASLEHARFPGTVSLGTELLAQAIHARGASLARHGLRRLVLYSSHGGNRAAIDTAGLRLREEWGLLVVKASHFDVAPPGDVELPPEEWAHGLHAGAVETSMLLHLRPDLVRVDEVGEGVRQGAPPGPAEGTRRLGPEGEASFAWLAGDLDPSGIAGDPSLANAEAGARLVAHYSEALARTILEARAFPLERLV